MALNLICNRLAANLTSTTCPTPGGLNRKSWTFQYEQFTGAETKAASGALSGFTLITDELGIRGTGRPKKGSGVSSLAQAENGSSEVTQTLIQEYAFSTQAQLDALEAFMQAGNKVVFQELANGKTRVYFRAFGNETGTAEESTGTLLADDNSIMKVTLVGKEPKFPIYFEAPITGQMTQTAANRAYLDALTQPDAA